jgi:hypothetical protein
MSASAPQLFLAEDRLLKSVRGGLAFFAQADSPHGRGVLSGAKVGNGVAVGAGVAVATGTGVATCACAPAKKVTKPTRTHTLRKAIPDRIRVLAAKCRS